MPHVRGRLKTSSQGNCVWSDPFYTVNSKKPPKLQYDSATPQPFYSFVFLESGGLGGDEHLDHNNHSGLVSSENSLAITSAKLASKSSAKNAQRLHENV